MLRSSTITIAAIAACGVTLALGASVAVLPRVVPLADTVAPPTAKRKALPADARRNIPHKFMRGLPSAQ